MVSRRVPRTGSASIASRTAAISAKVLSQPKTVTRLGMYQAGGRKATKDSWPYRHQFRRSAKAPTRGAPGAPPGRAARQRATRQQPFGFGLAWGTGVRRAAHGGVGGRRHPASTIGDLWRFHQSHAAGWFDVDAPAVLAALPVAGADDVRPATEMWFPRRARVSRRVVCRCRRRTGGRWSCGGNEAGHSTRDGPHRTAPRGYRPPGHRVGGGMRGRGSRTRDRGRPRAAGRRSVRCVRTGHVQRLSSRSGPMTCPRGRCNCAAVLKPRHGTRGCCPCAA